MKTNTTNKTNENNETQHVTTNKHKSRNITQ